MTRRDFFRQAIAAAAAVPAIAHAQKTQTVTPLRLRIGMPDWSPGQRGDITKIALARPKTTSDGEAQRDRRLPFPLHL